MLTAEDFQNMSEDEMKQCTFIQVIELYLYNCLLEEDEITTFFNTLPKEYIERLTQPIADTAYLLLEYRRDVFEKAKDWAEVCYPDRATSLIIEKTLRQTFAPTHH